MAGAALLALLAFSLQWDLPLGLGPLTVYHNEMLLLAALPWGLLVLRRQGGLGRALPWALCFAPLAVWLLAHAPSLGAWDSVKALLRAGQFVLPVALAPLLLTRRRDLAWALRAVFLAGGLACLLALAQSALGADSPLNAGRSVEVINGFQAACAGMSHHNQFGSFLAAWLLLAAACALAGLERGAALAALALGVPALVCTYSRGSWLAFGLGLCFLFCVLPRALKWGLGALASAALGFGLFGPNEALRARLATLFQDGDRATFLRALLERTQGLPGWGLGDKGLHALLAELAPTLPLNEGARHAFLSHAHNTYLQIALAWGWPSLLLWALALLPLFWSVRLALAVPGPRRLWGLALAGSLAAFLLQANTDVLVLHARGAAISLCWGLLLAALALEEAPAAADSFRVLGRRFYQGSVEGMGRLILERLKERPRRGLSVHVVNVHTLIDGGRDAELGRSQDEADFLLPDGRPLSLAAKLLGSVDAGHVRGPDLMRWLALEGRGAGLRHYFYGGVPGAPEAVAASLTAKAPGMAVAGAESPPFRELSDLELQDLVVRLRELDADLLWLGLGAPKQEKLMARLKRLGCPCVMVGVGAAFDYESGAKTEAPAWMQSAGLEWLFRLVSEPGRLWKRYLSTNPRFVARVTLEAAGLGWTRNPLERGLRIAALLALVAAFCMAASEARLGALALAGLAVLEASARRQGAAS